MTHGTKNLLNYTTGNAEEERGEANAAVIAWLIAAVSTAAFVSLWFWEVRRVLNDRKSIVDSAAGQLTSFRRRAEGAPCDKEFTQVLRRSESIYYQAVHNYNRTFSRPWVYLPARLMGFRRAPEQPADADIH